MFKLIAFCLGIIIGVIGTFAYFFLPIRTFTDCGGFRLSYTKDDCHTYENVSKIDIMVIGRSHSNELPAL